MEKKLGRTFKEALTEHIEDGGTIEEFHRDIDEVLTDPTWDDIWDAFMKENPEEAARHEKSKLKPGESLDEFMERNKANNWYKDD